MRTSKKESLITCAIDIIEQQGIEALTYESLASASGLSKSGLIYHFPTRHDLQLAIHSFLADRWRAELLSIAGAAPEDLTEAEKLRAYVITQSSNASRADVLIALDSHTHPDFLTAWESVTSDWSPAPESPEYVVRLMADGLWMHDSISETPLTSSQRAALSERILESVDKQR